MKVIVKPASVLPVARAVAPGARSMATATKADKDRREALVMRLRQQEEETKK